jgi:enamine deaminase RidA (YjgF/YER057c/UK114 family)
MRKLILVVLVGVAILPSRWSAQQPKDKDLLLLEKDEPQVRELPETPPTVVVIDTGRLVFFVSPLRSEGLLSQQANDAVRSLIRQAGSASIAKLRAFVAGTGDTRRVRAVVSEIFTEKRLPLPALTVVQVGALPSTGVQILIEATAAARQAVEPAALAFLSAQTVEQEGLPGRVAPLVRKSVEALKAGLIAAGLEGRDVLRTTCFVSALGDYGESRRMVAAEFPRSLMIFVQPVRAPVRGAATCEAVAQTRKADRVPLRVVGGVDGSPPGGLSRVAVVSAPRIALTGSQIAFGFREVDARLAFQRMGKALEEKGCSWGEIASISVYALSPRIGNEVRRIGAEFLSRTKPPAGTVEAFEDLPALDASFGMDVVAVPKSTQ